MGCGVGEVTERLENELCSALLILQHFRHFTYVTTHSPTLPSLFLRHSSFSNPSVASPTSQFILRPFFRFSYVTSSSVNSPNEPPIGTGTLGEGGNENPIRHYSLWLWESSKKYRFVVSGDYTWVLLNSSSVYNPYDRKKITNELIFKSIFLAFNQ